MMEFLRIVFAVLLVDIVHSQDQCNKLQLCAPVATLPGQEPYLEGLRGQQGEKGLPGPAGPPGTPASPEVEFEVYDLKAKVEGLMETKTRACPAVTYKLPRKRQNQDFVWYRRHIPSFKAATACAWVNITDLSHPVSVASYAASTALNNDFLIYLTSPTNLNLHVSSGTYNIPVTLSANTQAHLCATFDSSTASAYVDGIQTGSVSGKIPPTTGGGSFILGQDQDKINAGGLDASQSFSGTISNYMMWPRVLTSYEINAIYSRCICPIDDVITMTIDRVEMFGQAGYDIPWSCPVSP